MGGALESIRSVGRSVSELDVTLDMVEAIITGETHGMGTEGAAFGTRITECGEDNSKIRAISGVALCKTHMPSQVTSSMEELPAVPQWPAE